MLVFWESTRACLLACKHCRAEAQAAPAPGELTSTEGMHFIESLTEFGRPYPVLILTGGDVLMRPDAFELVRRARELGIPVGLAPSVTQNLTSANIDQMVNLGVKMVSISLDGATAETHEGIRGIARHFSDTVRAIEQLVAAGLNVQINTVVMRRNVNELPAILQILKQTGASVWEVFFLVKVGRGQTTEELSARECEDVGHFLYDASRYDLIVRTVEGPFFRRIVKWRNTVDDIMTPPTVADRFGLTPLYRQLAAETLHRLGDPVSQAKAQSTGTRDGKGIIFVGYDGTVSPAGFLPIPLGNVRHQDLAAIYRTHPLLKDIRASRFSGRCGECDYKDICGGSRARAYASTKDPLGEDPACFYPGSPE